MAILMSIIWGVMTPLIMVLTMQHYLPRLSLRIQKTSSEAPKLSDEDAQSAPVEEEVASAADADHKYCIQNILLAKKWARWTLLIIAAAFAAWCGYSAGLCGTSVIGQLKMTVAFAVLACVFITDLELFLIPNLCSLVLIGVRVLTILVEFIWMRDVALSYLIESAVAMVTCLIALLAMAMITRGGIGMGDVKLFSSIGFLCGFRAPLYTLILAFVICALVSTIFLLIGKKRLKDSLPLGPFVLVGFGISVLLAII